MVSSDAEDQAARAFNAGTAERYDATAYAPEPDPMLDLERVLGLGLLYGSGPKAAPEVLDIGCGGGGQLARAADQTAGRLVGTDISRAACAEAERKLGGRAVILPADILDLDPEKLGAFDVIYCVGVLYVVPPSVRRRTLELIAVCLKPGGVAVVSYYAGGLGLMRAELNRMIRTAAGSELAQEARLDQARAFLNQVAGQFQRGDPGLPAQTAQLTATYTDRPTLLHESLCEAMTALHTTELEAALAPQGVGFLSYLYGMPYAGLAGADQRAEAADVFDFMWGGYRYGLFGRPAEAGEPRASRAQGWSTVLARQPGGPSFPAPADYRAAGGGGLRIESPLLQAALEAMGKDGLARPELQAAVQRRLAQAGLAAPRDAEAELDAELHRLWPTGGATPLWLGVHG